MLPIEQAGAKVDIPGYVAMAPDNTERQGMEEKLRLQSAALEAAAVAIAITDLEGTILWVNSAFAALTGYTAEEAVGLNPRVLKSGRHDQAFYADLWNTILAGKVWRGELANRRKDGTPYDEEMTITPVLDEVETIRNFIAIKQDVTERKRAEEERRFRNAILSTQMETSIDGILVVGRRSGEILSHNRRFVDMWGIPPEVIDSGSDQRVLQSVLSKLLDPEEFLQRAKQLYANRQETSQEEVLLRDGRTLERYSAPMFGSDGQYYGRIWYFRDITERKRAEEGRREAEAQFRSLFAAIPLPTFLWDLETLRYLEVNDAAVAHSGYSRDELLGMRITDIIPPEAVPGIVARMHALGGESRGQGRHRLKDGRVAEVEADVHALRFRGRRAVLAVIRDITEQKRAEEKLKLAVADLARSNKDLEQFAYVASHDLQEPLRMVSSYTQLLARRYQGQLDATANKYIAYAVDGANRMQRLIEDLLAYSRVGTRAKGFAATDCAAVLDQSLANLKAAMEQSGAVVTHGPLPTVVHDNLLLVQLFQNLIGNAIKFQVEAPPRIHVSAEQKGEEWVLAVRDNGIGIDPQYAERIFTIFQRLHTNEEYAGTGIGLAICKKIVERCGGRIWVESQPGTGSTFYFTVPLGGDGV
jgi:PAS domain S-box-containing protein